jgi:PPOX class probable F420-dependent enzyme
VPAHDPAALPEEVLAFLRERHLATLTLVRPGGRPHVTPVGVTWAGGQEPARIITWEGAVKARLLERHGTLAAAVCQVDGGRWLTLEGTATVTADPVRCAEGVRRYAERYSPPKDRGPDRRVIELAVATVLGRA